MDSTQRKIFLVTVSATIVFVLAFYWMIRPPQVGLDFTLGGIGFVEGKGDVLLVAGDYLRLKVPRLLAAALVSFTWVTFVVLFSLLLKCFRRAASKI